MNPIQTQRLILRNFLEKDLDDLYEYLSDKTVVEFEPYKPMTKAEVQENLAWRISTDEMIAVELKDTGKLIGNVYVGNGEFESKEIGYVFNKSYWGKGYAKEACHAVIEELFNNHIHRICAYCDQKNPSSWKLLEALGFTKEGTYAQNVYFWKDENGNPIWKDTYEYALLNTLKN